MVLTFLLMVEAQAGLALQEQPVQAVLVVVSALRVWLAEHPPV